MGSYIPSYWDNQIRAALNGRFSDTTIPVGDPAHHPGHAGESFMEQMMRHHGHENMFDRHHPQPLERVAHRLAFSLGLGPAPANDDARRRWYWLLNSGSPILTGTTVADDIRNAIAGALTAGSGFASIQFDLTYDTTQVPRYLLDLVDTGSVRKLTLISNMDAILPTPTLVQQPLNPPPFAGGGGETPINNVHIP